ncbi:MAG: hypothetical protein JXR52_11385 [Bacteroidales bacterium]|nr:hypothetical protein [Bacteroidales bacterium]MBN2699416.1 hypothetical protein [Bacteroidales bacterium]
MTCLDEKYTQRHFISGRIACLILLFLFAYHGLMAQGPDAQETYNPDTLRSRRSARADTVARIDPDTVDHSPTRAIMFALALPGLGQAYNHKYFKIPIVYAALGGAGYAIHFNNTQYKQASLNYALDPSDLNERYLRAWRRNLEISYIALAAVYALQVIDAYVDANLFAWDVSPDLSLRIAPDIRIFRETGGGVANSYGLSCSMSFNVKRR